MGIRVLLDSDKNTTPGWKFNEYEMKGVPLRIELGPRDLQNNIVMVSRRDTLEKFQLSIEELETKIPELLEDVHNTMFEKALKNREEKTFLVEDYEQFKKMMSEKQGFAKTMWCGDAECEKRVKEETAATIRCIPFEQENLGDVCPFCGKPAKHMVYIAKAY